MPEPLETPRLILDADPDGDGTTETGVFEMAGDVEVTPSVRSGYVGRGGEQVNAVVKSLLRQYGDASDLSPEQRRTVALDVGGGEHVVEVQFTGWSGATDASGDPVQWGNDATEGVSQTSATGADPLTQIEVLMRYVTTGQFDSRGPATLEYGQHYSGGLYEPLPVIPEGPEATKTFESPNTFSGRMTLVAAQDVTGYADALARGEQ